MMKITAVHKKYFIALGSIILTAGIIGTVMFFNQKTYYSQPSTQSYTQTEKISATSTLKINFAKEIDKKSVESNLQIPSDIDAKSSWEDNTLVITPKKALEQGKAYVITIGTDAKFADGSNFQRELRYRFIVAGAPKLISHIPEETGDVPLDAKITLVFDRPMIPLMEIQELRNKGFENWPITIKPAISGEWRWLGTTAAQFVPSNKLLYATEYTVNVPQGIKTLNDSITTEDFTWSFETSRPKITRAEPSNDTKNLPPDGTVTLYTNQPINLSSLKEHTTFRSWNIDPAEEVVLDFTYGFTKDENDNKLENRNIIVLKPAKQLSLDTLYALNISSGYMGIEGNLAAEKSFSMQTKTVGPMWVRDLDYNNYSINIQFTNSLKEDQDLHKFIDMEPKPEGWDGIDMAPSIWNEANVHIQPQLRPSTEYTVTIKEGIRDQYGQKLETPFKKAFATDPLPSKITLNSKGIFGFFEKNKSPVFYLNAVNVSKIDMALAKLSWGEFLSIRKNNQYGLPNITQLPSYTPHTVYPEKIHSNEWESIAFDVEKRMNASLGSGVYVFTATGPEYKDYQKNPITLYRYFAMTDMSITLKYSHKKALAWVTDMQTGDPVSNATVSFYNLNQDNIYQATTDNGGFAELDIDIKALSNNNNRWRPEFWVTAEKDNDFAFVSSDWSNGIEPYNFGLNDYFRGGDNAEYLLDSYVYTERELYRPGDTVYFKGVVRLRDTDGIMRAPKSVRKAIVTVTDSNGNDVYSKSLPISYYGSFNDSLPIDPKAPLGNYYISMKMTPENDMENNYGRGTSFAVLEFRKPEYQVEVTTENPEYFSDDTILANVQGNYFFGAPLGNAEVNWRATSLDYYFNRYTDGYYSFALEDSWCWWGCQRETSVITRGSGKLTEQGSYTIKLPYSLDDKAVGQVVTIEADVTDPNNQVVSNRVSVPVHNSGVYVGLQQENYSVAAGEEAGIKIVTVDTDGSIVSGQRVQLKLYSREWNTIKKKGVDGEYYYDNEPKDTFITSQNISTDNNGKHLAKFIIPDGGQYKVVASTKDDNGRESQAGVYIYAYANSYYNWPRSNNDRIEIVPDKPEYKVGDTAKILVKSPYQGKGVKALITVEREHVMTKKIVDITTNAQSIDIPITNDLIPNAYISVVIVKPRQGETFDKNGLDTGTPAYKMGYTKLVVDTKSKELNVSIQTDKQKYEPRETVQAKIQVLDDNGNPVVAEVSLGVVDLSIISLTGFTLPNLISVFYSQRPLGVVTTQMLIYVMERFKPGSKGGGGGDFDGKRENFKDTVYWNPTIVTDQNGQAKISFELPDNLTTWQLLAIAHTRENQFGAAAHEIVETKKVILRPVRPRFAVNGDQIKMGAIVHNFLQEEQEFTVSLKGEGFTMGGEDVYRVRVKPDQQQKVIFDVTVDSNVDKLTMVFKADSEFGKDEIQESIIVMPYGVPQAMATSGLVETSVTEQLQVPAKKDVSTGELHVTVSPTIASYIPDGLEYLAKFPYGCAEQTVSSFLPNIALASLQNFDAFKIVSNDELQTNIVAGLEKLSKYQRGDGGFGYWENSNKSYPYLSAYVLFALQTTKNAGIGVDQGMMDRAAKYLDGVLRSLNVYEPINLTERAYILYVLSEIKTVDVSLVNNLYEKWEQLPLFSQAQLAMTLQTVKSQQTQEKAQELMNNIMIKSKITSRGVHFEDEADEYYRWVMSTNIRTTAFVLQALLRIQPENEMVPKIVRYLLAVRENGHWDTTQSTVMSIFALVEYLQQTQELDGDFYAKVTVDGKQKLNEHFETENILTRKDVSVALKEIGFEKTADITIQKDGMGKLYYDVLFSYFYTADNIPPAEQGIGILREMEPVGDTRKEVHVGSTQKIKLTITVPEDRHFVAVESPVPAGMEIIDLSFVTSQQNLLQEENTETKGGYWWKNNIWRFNHHEFRDDKVFLFADYLPAGVYEYEYLARATTPGTFRYRPARVWEMYFPETFGQTNGSWFTVREE